MQKGHHGTQLIPPSRPPPTKKGAPNGRAFLLWAREELNLRPHAYQAAAERLLAPMGANFRGFWAFGADERLPAPMGAGTVRVTIPAELTKRGPAEPAPPAAILRPRSIAA